MARQKKVVSRRDFLVAGALITAAGALAACAPKTITETQTVTRTATGAPVTTTVAGAPVTTTVTGAPVTTTVPGAPVTTTVTVTPTAPVGPVKLTVLNPRGVITPPPTSGLSPRVTTLAGKKVGLYDNGKGGFTAFLNELEVQLKKAVPTVTILRYASGFDLGDSMAAKIAAEVDTVVYGVGD